MAMKHFRQAVAIAREIGHQRGEGIFLGNIGIVYAKLKELDHAADHFTQAIAIARKIGNKRNEAVNIGKLAEVSFEQGNEIDAERGYRHAISLADDVFPLAAGARRGSLAWLLAKQGRLDETPDLLVAGESQVEAQPDEYARFLCKKGQVCFIVGDVVGAQTALSQAREMALEVKVAEQSELRQSIVELARLLTGKSDG